MQSFLNSSSKMEIQSFITWIIFFHSSVFSKNFKFPYFVHTYAILRQLTKFRCCCKKATTSQSSTASHKSGGCYGRKQLFCFIVHDSQAICRVPVFKQHFKTHSQNSFVKNEQLGLSFILND